MSMGPARDLGPCILAWGPTTLGSFWDEVRFKFEEQFAEVFEATFGATPVDAVFIGAGACELTVPFTRITIAQLTSLVTGGSSSGTSGTGTVVRANAVGTAMYSSSLPLFVKPIVAGVAAGNGSWLRIYHAYPVVNFDLAYNNKDQRVYGVTFRSFPDPTTRNVWSVGKVLESAT